MNYIKHTQALNSFAFSCHIFLCDIRLLPILEIVYGSSAKLKTNSNLSYSATKIRLRHFTSRVLSSSCIFFCFTLFMPAYSSSMFFLSQWVEKSLLLFEWIRIIFVTRVKRCKLKCHIEENVKITRIDQLMYHYCSKLTCR